MESGPSAGNRGRGPFWVQSAIRKEFTRRGGHSALRTGFTLTELIVSVAVLGLMMTLAGAVFHLTLKSTGEARALTSVTQRHRDFEAMMREDLRGVRPEASVMVIIPARVNTHWTEASREGDDVDATGKADPADGYTHPEDFEREILGPAGVHVIEPPRADRLMFVTARRGISVVDARISAGLQQVVYGHAILGDWYDNDPLPTSEEWKWRPQHGETTDADRRARFDRAMLVGSPPTPQTGTGRVLPFTAQKGHLARRSVLLVDYDNVANNAPLLDVDADPARRSQAIADLLDNDPAAGPAQYALLEGYRDVVASPVILGTRNTAFDLIQGLRHVPDPTATLPPESTIETHPSWYARSELDLTPPPTLANRLGHSALAGCASFKVEFALDIPELRGLGEVLWIDPADLVSGWTGGPGWTNPPTCPTDERLQALHKKVRAIADGGEEWLGPPSGLIPPANPAQRALDKLDELRDFVLNPDDLSWGPRFTLADINGSQEPMARWYTKSPPADGTGVDRYFPTALRITMDVYDDEGRFERPIRQVMVLKVGG